MDLNQVWGMVLLDQESRLLTGSADSELRAWDIDYLSQVDLTASLQKRHSHMYTSCASS